MRNLAGEIKFRTARSGGKGGQNVNKVETMAEACWNVSTSLLASEEEKKIILRKLASRINAEGFLVVRSQQDRTQLGNKQLATKKLNELVEKALIVQKKRKSTKPTAESKEKRLETKKQLSERKESRKKIKE